MASKIHTVKKREYKCHMCQRKIPTGHKYWIKTNEDGDRVKEHTNCDLYTKEQYLGDLDELNHPITTRD